MAIRVTDPLVIPMQKHIKPLDMNGLSGRMLRMPAPKGTSREILLVYGHHASLERMYGIAESFNEYGAVTMPDLPGFGGMESFYKLGMAPTIDNLADYLASFVKLKYRSKKVTIAGMSLGFVIVTRMLQRYPELVNKIDLLISIVGFSHKYDLTLSKKRTSLYRCGAYFFSRRLPANFFYNVALHPSVIRSVYVKTLNGKKKIKHLPNDERAIATEFEVELWRSNDVRTHMSTAVGMFTLDNCTQQVDIPVHHVSVDTDQYFDSGVVEQHMRVIFTDFTEHIAKMPNHAPSILASKDEAAPFIPQSIRKLFEATA